MYFATTPSHHELFVTKISRCKDNKTFVDYVKELYKNLTLLDGGK